MPQEVRDENNRRTVRAVRVFLRPRTKGGVTFEIYVVAKETLRER